MGQVITCTSGTSTAVIDSDQRTTCVEGGGNVTVTDSDDPNRGKGLCFVRDVLTRSLGEQILNLGGTFKLAVDFRDKVLKESKVGSSYLDAYYQNLPTIYAIVACDPEILFLSIKTWTSTWLLANALLSVHEAQKKNESCEAEKIVFSKKNYEAVSDLIHRLRKNTSDEKFIQILDDFHKEISLYMDQNMAKCLAILKRDITK